MKLSVFIFILSTFIQLHSLRGSNDSLIKFSDLSFRNNFEEVSLRQLGPPDAKTDMLNIFLNHYQNKENYSASSARQMLEACVNDLKKETEGLTESKKVKLIYKHVHQRFLKMYKLTNSFSDIFEKGEYNCVSGSALYAMIFQMMEIPYQIVEAPQHVFLFAYPETFKIIIETTQPANGYFAFSDAYVEKFINYMYETKLISTQEYENNTKNQLFNTYYFSQKGMSLRDLAAIQYANYSVYYADANDNVKALEEIKKAYFINPNERFKYVLQTLLKYVVSNGNYKNLQDVNNLAILCRNNSSNNKEISNENIRYEFARLTTEQLITNSDYTQYAKSFEKISQSIKDSALAKEIAFHYYYELARLGYMNSKETTYELQNLKAAYIIKPRHADLQSIIKSYFAQQLEKTEDPNSIMKQTDEFIKIFDFLNTDKQFNVVRANCMLELAYQGFVLNEIAKGENYLNSFEKLCSNNDDLKANDRFVEKAYSTAASYYYKKGNTNKTRQLLKTGIHYAPQNFGLQLRLKQAN